MRALAVLVWLALAGAVAAAPEHGLMFNRTGLPLVFPLQVRTDPGRDVALVLRDAETGEAAVGGYIEGGRFFRILVPPGTFTLDFASGTGWEGMETLFGPETERFTYPEPLTFAVTGVARKSGHLIDLRGDARMADRAIALCQYLAFDADDIAELRDYRDGRDIERDEGGAWEDRRARLYGDEDRRRLDPRAPRSEEFRTPRGYRETDREDPVAGGALDLPDHPPAAELRERLCG